MSTTNHVLVAVDGTDASERAAIVASSLFGPGARYTFAHVAEPVPMTPPGQMPMAGVGVAPAVAPGAEPDEPGGENEVRDSARSVALSAAAASGLDVAETIGLIGDPARQIVQAAGERSVDVIVVAAHERGWLAEMLSGSTVDDIQGITTIPVLVVPASTSATD